MILAWSVARQKSRIFRILPTILQRDIKSRSDELREIIRRHDTELVSLRRNREGLDLERHRDGRDCRADHAGADGLDMGIDDCARCEPQL
jgi:hypothetical protein